MVASGFAIDGRTMFVGRDGGKVIGLVMEMVGCVPEAFTVVTGASVPLGLINIGTPGAPGTLLGRVIIIPGRNREKLPGRTPAGIVMPGLTPAGSGALGRARFPANEMAPVGSLLPPTVPRI